MDALYQKQILDYAHKSRDSAVFDNAAYHASLDNPTCGDRVDISLAVTAGIIDKVGVAVRGCALCEAGAGLAIECFTGSPVTALHELTEQFETWINGGTQPPPLAAMEQFTPVRSIRNRHKCVLLAFHASVEAVKTA